jgi:hypothetical protein
LAFSSPLGFRSEVGSAAAAACGQVGRIDKAMRPRMRRLLRKSVIFFENMDHNPRPKFASATQPAMVEFGRSGSWPTARRYEQGALLSGVRQGRIVDQK